ncbi:MAG: dihydropteroate synthase [Kiritimatiellae bacterium]|nr:dihydropteroate synthase [Kiritimatiellia bacterium]
MKCKVMGIVNVTPDSFSDGGMYFRPEEAIRRAKNMVEEGAEIIDLGGESTRPGSTPIIWEEEWGRLEPVIMGLKGLVLSVDTYHPETAEKALEAGVKIINCVYAEPIPEMLKLLDKFPEAELVLPTSCYDLNNSSLIAHSSSLIWDPMIGFGTERDEDLRLLRSTAEFKKMGRVLIGASRKRIVKKLTGEKVTGKNLGGNLGIAIWCAIKGADIVRVHDVKETVQALKVVEALEG